MNPVFRRFYEANRRFLAALAIVLLANVVMHLLLSTRLDGALAEAEKAYAASEREVRDAELAYGRLRLEAMLLDDARTRINRLNRETLLTKAERFPEVDAKIKDVSTQFGLASDSYNYGYQYMPMEELEQLTVSFQLKGGYRDLRRFVSAIEQAKDESGRDLFFAVERVTLQDSTERGQELNLQIAVSTYFHEPGLARPARPKTKDGARKKSW